MGGPLRGRIHGGCWVAVLLFERLLTFEQCVLDTMVQYCHVLTTRPPSSKAKPIEPWRAN
jgi:hypothetical protein